MGRVPHPTISSFLLRHRTFGRPIHRAAMSGIPPSLYREWLIFSSDLSKKDWMERPDANLPASASAGLSGVESVVPAGLGSFSLLAPALTCRAQSFRPAGLWPIVEVREAQRDASTSLSMTNQKQFPPKRSLDGAPCTQVNAEQKVDSTTDAPWSARPPLTMTRLVISSTNVPMMVKRKSTAPPEFRC